MEQLFFYNARVGKRFSMQNLIDIILFAIALGSIATLAFLVYKLKLQKDKMQASIDQLLIDKSILLERVSTLAAEKDANSLKEDDGFIKFLSNSRDWAFSYIEDVQEKMKNFQESVDVVLPKLSKTRDLNVKTLIQAYKTLAEVMPEKEKNNE